MEIAFNNISNDDNNKKNVHPPSVTDHRNEI